MFDLPQSVLLEQPCLEFDIPWQSMSVHAAMAHLFHMFIELVSGLR